MLSHFIKTSANLALLSILICNYTKKHRNAVEQYAKDATYTSHLKTLEFRNILSTLQNIDVTIEPCTLSTSKLNDLKSLAKKYGDSSLEEFFESAFHTPKPKITTTMSSAPSYLPHPGSRPSSSSSSYLPHPGSRSSSRASSSSSISSPKPSHPELCLTSPQTFPTTSTFSSLARQAMMKKPS